MKITSFNPLIVTNHADEITSLFEALGFETVHKPSDVSSSGNSFNDFRMRDPNGFHVDITGMSVPFPQDMTGIRMNVDDFEEAYQLLTEHGFKPADGRPVTITESVKAQRMVAPSGFSISLIQHIREEDK